MDLYDLNQTKTFLISQKALIVRDGRLLILQIAPELVKRASPLWELPGGLLEMEEDGSAGLEREVMEETGLKVTVGEPISVSFHWAKGFKFKDGRVLDARVAVCTFECQTVEGSVVLSDENSGFHWATLEELAAFEFHANSQTAIQRYLAKETSAL